MKILWCHEVSYLDKPVYEYQDFAERLAGRGHAVEVIDFSEARVTSSGTQRVSRTGEGEISLTPIPHGNVPVLKYFEARARFHRMLSSRLRQGNIDAVFVYSVFINGTQAIRLARRHGVPAIYRVLDAYHQLRPDRASQAILRAGERYIYRNADHVLVTNEKMGDYVRSLAGDAVPASVLDHGVDCVHFLPRTPDTALMERYGLRDGDEVIVFLGTTYAFSGLIGLIRRMADIVRRRPKAKLLIVGGGELDDALAAEVNASGLQSCVILTGMVSYQDVPRYLSLGRVAVNPFEINDITRDIIPIKILQYQACGLPVLSTPLPDLLRKHDDVRSGVRYSATDASDTFVEVLADMLDQPDATFEQGRRGRRFMERAFSVDVAIDHLETTFTTLAAARRRGG
ncbi:glycosyltransferase [Novilysobacter luteus]|uniref:D-inositol-3-phosphate glycosyltransferase n=1 Tax=Novilysobacter luteus TaxID=2822368 RepID=A0ABN7R134_9GAMM|nr:glycosyltransferase [Lysobacter luteus]CAG4976970.1 D-inositol-3-phosphate glycosyltransferase [Lysobacter luteus]